VASRNCSLLFIGDYLLSLPVVMLAINSTLFSIGLTSSFCFVLSAYGRLFRLLTFHNGIAAPFAGGLSSVQSLP